MKYERTEAGKKSNRKAVSKYLCVCVNGEKNSIEIHTASATIGGTRLH